MAMPLLLLAAPDTLALLTLCKNHLEIFKKGWRQAWSQQLQARLKR
jgi:hypothetical protein